MRTSPLSEIKPKVGPKRLPLLPQHLNRSIVQTSQDSQNSNTIAHPISSSINSRVSAISKEAVAVREAVARETVAISEVAVVDVVEVVVAAMEVLETI